MIDSAQNLELRQQQANLMLGDLRLHFVELAKQNRRWKQRHADLSHSTLLIVGALSLIILAEAYAIYSLLEQGCK